jgi:phage baseplate assembly protein W
LADKEGVLESAAKLEVRREGKAAVLRWEAWELKADRVRLKEERKAITDRAEAAPAAIPRSPWQ